MHLENRLKNYWGVPLFLFRIGRARLCEREHIEKLLRRDESFPNLIEVNLVGAGLVRPMWPWYNVASQRDGGGPTAGHN